MPILPLRCIKCKQVFEFFKLRSFDKPPEVCPKEGCDGTEFKAAPACGSFNLKGSGWANGGFN